jgi:hypothetical protein
MDSSATLLKPTDAFDSAERADIDSAAFGSGDDLQAPASATLTVLAVGLSPDDQQALNDLFFGDQLPSPRLLPVEEDRFDAADVVLIDGRDRQARQWWRRHRATLSNRPVVWMGQRSPCETHTTLVLPVVWSLVPLILYRAAQAAPRRHALAERVIQLNGQSVMLVAPQRKAAVQLRWMLETQSFRVTVARSTREGLAALHAAPYAGVILAPGGSDDLLKVADFCQRIRRLDRRLGRLPVLVLSQDIPTWQRFRARLFGDVKFSPWPRHSAELKRTLAPWVRGELPFDPAKASH